jgi:hypothetical protein
MKGYGQFCPIAKASEVLGERWTNLVIRELIAGSENFNDLRRGLPLISPSLLSARLKSLERAGVVRRTADGKRSTSARPPARSRVGSSSMMRRASAIGRAEPRKPSRKIHPTTVQCHNGTCPQANLLIFR